MKITKYKNSLVGKKKTIVNVTRSEAIALLATLSDQLFQGKPPSGRTEFLTESGEFWDMVICPNTFCGHKGELS